MTENRYDKFEPEKYFTTVELGKIDGDITVYKDMHAPQDDDPVLYKSRWVNDKPNVFYIPKLTPEQMAEHRRERSEYDTAHCCCPRCGGDNLLSTLVAYKQGKNLNECWCSCGWKGIGDDLVPMKQNNGTCSEIGELPLN